MIKKVINHDVFTQGTAANLTANKCVKYATGVVVPIITAVASVFCAAQNLNSTMNNKK